MYLYFYNQIKSGALLDISDYVCFGAWYSLGRAMVLSQLSVPRRDTNTVELQWLEH